MCGIAGIYFRDGHSIEHGTLRAMATAIAHRGPDGEGLFVNEGSPSVGLVNRRLAVIDIDGGEQPMTVDDGAYTIVYNGELFNADELRRELHGHGHEFRTRCDTEVVVRAYAEWGHGLLDRLLGMWAFCIWDARARSLFLARDRLGEKPLLYAVLPDGVAFASEMKALVASGLVARDLDPQALPHYLSSFTIPEPYTLIRGVRRLPSGHALEVTPDGTREFSYWDCAVIEEDGHTSRAGHAEAVEELLEDAVRRRLISDVPLGVLLSGGVDSRLMATFAARAQPSLSTFTLGFDDPAADERAQARQVALRLRTRHHESVVHADDAAQDLPTLLEAYDEPGESLTQMHFISRFARQNVTVALSGLGGDELFASYPTHVAVNVLARLDAAPRLAGDVLRGCARVLPVRRVRRLAELSGMSPDARVARELLHQTPARLRAQLLSPEVRAEVDLEAPVHHIEQFLQRARSGHPLNRLLYVYLKTYVPDELLRAADAMSMLHSLELRVPFLDHRLVERALAIPAHHKMRLRTGKLVLRDVADRTLDEPTLRVKRGFSLPVARWLRGPLGEQVREALSEPVVRRRGLFDPIAARDLLRRFDAGDTRVVPPLMMLYTFETWAERWLDGQHSELAPTATTAAPNIETGRPDLSVVIVNWNTLELTRNCLASLARHLQGTDHEVIVIDNASRDGSPEMIASDFPDVRLIRNSENLGFGVANNQAMRLARGKWFLLLNSDTELVDESVADLFARVRAEPQIGIAHCRLQFPDGRLQHTAYRFPSIRLALFEGIGMYKLLPGRAGEILLGGYWKYGRERDVDWVAGAFMLLPREVFDQTGGFDERLFMYGEDMEWCYRIRDLGWRVRYYPTATVVHVDHASSEIRWGDERVAICLKRQYDIYGARHGHWAATVLMAIGIAAAALRDAYYAGRILQGGQHAETYRPMRRYQRSVLRTLLALMRDRA